MGHLTCVLFFSDTENIEKGRQTKTDRMIRQLWSNVKKSGTERRVCWCCLFLKLFYDFEIPIKK